MKRALAAGLLCFAIAGCGTARLIRRDQYGGVFALEGDRQKAMEDAQSQMTQHCHGPYQIVAEGEEVVGTESAQQNETYVRKDGTVVNQGGQTTHDATEWRVQYQCTAAGAPPPPPPSGGNYQVPSQQPPPNAQNGVQ